MCGENSLGNLNTDKIFYFLSTEKDTTDLFWIFEPQKPIRQTTTVLGLTRRKKLAVFPKNKKAT
jgi:hypothetical protein